MKKRDLSFDVFVVVFFFFADFDQLPEVIILNFLDAQ